MKKMIQLVLSLFLVAGLLIPASASAQDTEPLVVGMEAGYPPYNWTQGDDSNDALPIQDSPDFAGGYDVLIARRIGEILGREVIIMKMEWEGLIPALQSNRIDLIIAGMSPTEERAEVIDFSDPYYELQFAIVVNADGDFTEATSLEDFAGAKITGQQATLHYNLVEQIPEVDMQEAMRSFPIMRAALEAGRIDGYISELPEAQSASNANDNFAFVIPEPNFDVPDADKQLAIGMKKGSDLLSAVNEALAQITEEERAAFLQQAIETQPAALEE